MTSRKKQMVDWLRGTLSKISDATGFSLAYQGLSRRQAAPSTASKKERFTVQAKRVLMIAQQEAEQNKQSFIMPEYLLLGVFRVEPSLARQALLNLGIEQTPLEEEVRQLSPAIVNGEPVVPDLHDTTKKVLELAVDEARRRNHVLISPEHLLLGITRQSDSGAVLALGRLGVTPDLLRGEMRRLLLETPPATYVSHALRVYQAQTRIRQMVVEQKISAEAGNELLDILSSEVSGWRKALRVSLDELENDVISQTDSRILGFRMVNDQAQAEIRMSLVDTWMVAKALTYYLARPEANTFFLNRVPGRIELFLE